MARLKGKSQKGFIVTIELLLLATILVIGLIVGMVSLRDSVLAELSDASEAIGALNQSYNILGANNAANTAATSGSEWQDNFDNSATGTIDDPIQTGDAGAATGDLNFVVGGDEQTPVIP
jgi:3-hydroxyisobutyrate dehydrogenase-like beta-hydroxyacid dehydrogenase